MCTASPPSSIYGSLEVFSVSVLKCPALADFYCYRTQIRSNAVQGPVRGRERIETADDTSEVVLMLRHESLDLRDSVGPHSEE